MVIEDTKLWKIRIHKINKVITQLLEDNEEKKSCWISMAMGGDVREHEDEACCRE